MEFEYKGKLLSGKKTKGRITADTRRDALSQLEKQGITPFLLTETTTMSRDISFKRRLKHADFIMFLRQYSTMIGSGVSIAEATKTMSEQATNVMLKESLVDVSRQVGRGESLSVAAARHPKIFPELLTNMLFAGEVSGRLDEMLSDMADYYERDYKNRRTLVSSLIYPCIVAAVAVMLVIFLLAFIVPRFVDMFASFDAELPAITQLVMSMSDFTKHYWWTFAFVVVGAVLSTRLLRKNEAFMFWFDGYKLKAPLVGRLFHVAVLTRMTKTLGVLVSGSLPILQAMDITERVVPNRVMKGIVKDARDTLEQGGDISQVFSMYSEIPPILVQMIRVGEKTGSLDDMLHKVSTFYDDELEQLTARFGTFIEPVLIVGLTVVVGFIMLSIIIPMFSLYDSIL